MANGPKDYRNPKTTTTGSGGGTSKWLWYILGAIVLILLLAWLFGWFGGNEMTGATAIEEPIVTEEEVEVAPVDPEVGVDEIETAPAIETEPVLEPAD